MIDPEELSYLGHYFTLIITLALSIIGTLVTLKLASIKHRNGTAWGIVSLFVWPVTVLLLLILPKVQQIKKSSYFDSKPNAKTCPRCAETVKAEALVCRFCQHEFAPQA